MRISIWMAILIMSTTLPLSAKELDNVPEDFPTFVVPGAEAPLASLRRMFWLHYPAGHIGATLWDEWLTEASLWPAIGVARGENQARERVGDRLLERHIDADGYVATHQHGSIAHPQGWPFPPWNHSQGGGAWGWHFSYKDTIGPPWRGDELTTQTGWLLDGGNDAGIGEDGWAIELTKPGATLTAPKRRIDSYESPFLQLRWKLSKVEDAQPYIEWRRKSDSGFSPDRRMYFDAPDPDAKAVAHTVIPVYRHPEWNGSIQQLRIGFGNEGVNSASAAGSVVVQALFTTYDTRHNVNSQSFITGCLDYFYWSGDVAFLRRNVDRMRLALRHMLNEHGTLEENLVHTTWIGHDGRPGYTVNADGTKTYHSGHGIGNNYWDLVPFGGKDTYATLRYYDSVTRMAALEREIDEHPEWNVARGPMRFDPAFLARHAAEVKETGNRVFWNEKTGRFVACIDEDGVAHDYGYTFVNLEAIHYGFATEEHAKAILDWLDGKRIVEGDTSTGSDIYCWVFAPRATTKRNIEYYFWAWNGPETISFGDQVQDGGGVLGFSYHDAMARLSTRGPDDAWKRLSTIASWFDEVQKAGGYRKYYDGSRPGTLQGAGTPGGLGLDAEFSESVLVPQVLIDGFLGFKATAEGFAIDPKLPSDWPSLRIDGIWLKELTLDVEAARDRIAVRKKSGTTDRPWFVTAPAGEWTIAYTQGDGETKVGAAATSARVERRERDGAVKVDWTKGDGFVLTRKR